MEESQGQDPNQADVNDGTQDPNPPADSQEQPTQDSQLTTPQPDQPAPSEAERQQQVDGPQATVGPSGQVAEGTAQPSQFPSGAEQQAAEDQRQADLHAQRQEHNERTGGGSVNEGEVQAQRDVHNERATAGVPRPTEAEVQATRQDAERATAEEQAQQDQD